VSGDRIGARLRRLLQAPSSGIVRRRADDIGERSHREGFEPRDRISASRLAEAFGWRIRRRVSL